MSRAEEAARKAYPVLESKIGIDRTIAYLNRRIGYEEGYEHAEKDIEALILKYLDSRNERDYATVGWIKKNFGEYKKEIMGEE